MTGGLIESRFKPEEFEEVEYQAMHHQFVASALATKIAHEKNPDCKVGCMLTKLTYYPYTCKPEDVLQAQQDMRSTYCYSATQVFGEYSAYLLTKFKNEGPIIIPRTIIPISAGNLNFSAIFPLYVAIIPIINRLTNKIIISSFFAYN